MTRLTLTIAGAIFCATASFAAPDVKTQADINHPDIHDKVGQGPGDNANANPNGNNGNASNGGQIHGIANVPGQSDADPATGEPGFADQLETVHGGIGDKNKNADN
ncbi:hypothetical protein [Tateyamaria pelophila]|uniref:hypothetical protein n=1 Tax=Tateyamaria pelophila TaxID=328415 RepID=UPI001CBA923D|nr:hypothetical protein [Tateyamaria pelophila]